MENFLPYLWSALGAIVTALVSWGISRLIAFLNTKIKDERAIKFTTEFVEIVETTVLSLNQSVVDTLKKEGKFTEQAQKEIKEKCINIVLEKMTPSLKEYINNNYGDIRDYIADKIEAFIYHIKH